MNDTESTVSSDSAKKSKLPRLQLSGQLPLILCLLIIIGLLGIWRPWQAAPHSGDRTITVTGEAIVTATPDEYSFTPSYEFTGSDAKKALADATTKLNDIVDQLKKLGVPDSKIKTDTSGFNNSNGGPYYSISSSQAYTAYLTVTVDNKSLAQKVQDYLLTTTPSGSVTPQASFSKAKEKQLTDTARNQASKDARAKADQSAHNLGFKVGAVKSVQDQPDLGTIRPLYSNSVTDSAAGAKSTSLPIQAGENDLTYQVTVTYFVR